MGEVGEAQVADHVRTSLVVPGGQRCGPLGRVLAEPGIAGGGLLVGLCSEGDHVGYVGEKCLGYPETAGFAGW